MADVSAGLPRRLARLARQGAFWGAVGAAVTGVTGCDSTGHRSVVVTIANLPESERILVRAEYALDSQPGRHGLGDVALPARQFAIELPDDSRGALTVDISAMTVDSTSGCAAAAASGTLKLDGSQRQNLTVALPAVSAVKCDASQVQLELPPTDVAPLVAWGNAPDNIWVVGQKGVILHWDGLRFATVALPPELTAAPPIWRAVSGAGSRDVWIAGDGGAVVHWNGTQLSLVGATRPVDPPPNWVSLSVASPGQSVFFASSNGNIGWLTAGINIEIFTPGSTNVYLVYPLMPGPATPVPLSKTISFADVYCVAANDCWFVGYDPSAFAGGGPAGAGTILQAYTYNTMNVIFSDYSMDYTMPTRPVTRSPLRGIWGAYSGGSNLRRRLYVVGDNATVLTSTNSIPNAPANQPDLFANFANDFSAVSAAALMGRSLKLNAIGGTSLDDLWIVGDGGLLLRWDSTPGLRSAPFTIATTGLNANLSRVFSTGTANGRVYVSGEQQTFAAP